MSLRTAVPVGLPAGRGLCRRHSHLPSHMIGALPFRCREDDPGVPTVQPGPPPSLRFTRPGPSRPSSPLPTGDWVASGSRPARRPPQRGRDRSRSSLRSTPHRRAATLATCPHPRSPHRDAAGSQAALVGILTDQAGVASWRWLGPGAPPGGVSGGRGAQPGWRVARPRRCTSPRWRSGVANTATTRRRHWRPGRTRSTHDGRAHARRARFATYPASRPTAAPSPQQ